MADQNNNHKRRMRMSFSSGAKGSHSSSKRRNQEDDISELMDPIPKSFKRRYEDEESALTLPIPKRRRRNAQDGSDHRMRRTIPLTQGMGGGELSLNVTEAGTTRLQHVAEDKAVARRARQTANKRRSRAKLRSTPEGRAAYNAQNAAHQRKSRAKKKEAEAANGGGPSVQELIVSVAKDLGSQSMKVSKHAIKEQGKVAMGIASKQAQVARESGQSSLAAGRQVLEYGTQLNGDQNDDQKPAALQLETNSDDESDMDSSDAGSDDDDISTRVESVHGNGGAGDIGDSKGDVGKDEEEDEEAEDDMAVQGGDEDGLSYHRFSNEDLGPQRDEDGVSSQHFSNEELGSQSLAGAESARTFSTPSRARTFSTPSRRSGQAVPSFGSPRSALMISPHAKKSQEKRNIRTSVISETIQHGRDEPNPTHPERRRLFHEGSGTTVIHSKPSFPTQVPEVVTVFDLGSEFMSNNTPYGSNSRGYARNNMNLIQELSAESRCRIAQVLNVLPMPLHEIAYNIDTLDSNGVLKNGWSVLKGLQILPWEDSPVKKRFDQGIRATDFGREEQWVLAADKIKHAAIKIDILKEQSEAIGPANLILEAVGKIASSQRLSRIIKLEQGRRGKQAFHLGHLFELSALRCPRRNESHLDCLVEYMHVSGQAENLDLKEDLNLCSRAQNCSSRLDEQLMTFHGMCQLARRILAKCDTEPPPPPDYEVKAFQHRITQGSWSSEFELSQDAKALKKLDSIIGQAEEEQSGLEFAIQMLALKYHDIPGIPNSLPGLLELFGRLDDFVHDVEASVARYKASLYRNNIHH